MSDNTLRPIWTPADYEETLADAAKHRAIPGAYEAQAALYAEAERVGRHRKPHVITGEIEFGTKAHEMLLAGRAPALAEGTRILWKPFFDEAAVEGVIADVIEFDPEFPTMGRLYIVGWTERGKLGRTKITEDRVLATLTEDVAEHQGVKRATWFPMHTAEPQSAADVGLVVEPPADGVSYHATIDEGRPLPFRRNPKAECPSCWAPAGDLCDPFCLSRMTPDEQIAHRNAVIETTIAELDAGDMHPDVPPWADGRHMMEKVAEYSAIDCTIAGRHRVKADPFRRVSRLRAVLIVAVLVLVMALAALWASSRAHAETFDVCPSGLSGVATPDTSCAFADSVRAAFYWQPSWTVIARSPVTGKFYTMQCGRTDTTGTGWYDSKRCFGVNDAGAVLVVYVA